MRRLDSNALWGLLLIGMGVLFLMQNLGLLNETLSFVWPAAFAALSAAFFFFYFTRRDQWWAVIPAFTLLGLAGTVGLEAFSPALGEKIGGVIFLSSVSLAFWAVFFIRRAYWWAIIPAGAMLTLTVVAGADSLESTTLHTGSIFFFGLAATFAIVLMVSRMRWAIYPASVLFAIGAIIGLGAESIVDYILPVALIVVGLYLLLRVLRPGTNL